MGWPLRMFQQQGYYFVTPRCFQVRLLLRPSPEVNEVVVGVLARAVQQSSGAVRLHGYTFASNHFHLLVWAQGAALASFMQYLRASLSRKVGRLVDWRGGFWEHRYSAEPVLDDSELVGRLRYILAHGGSATAVLEGRGEDARRRQVQALLRDVEDEAWAKGKPALGVKAVQAQPPHTR